MFKWPWGKAENNKEIPFTVVLIKRTSGSKRGIHTTNQQIENVIKVTQSTTAPYIIFDCEDGTRLCIHHDMLLSWRSHLKEPK